jgi:endonuclease III
MAQTPLVQIVGALRKRYGKPKPPLPGREPLAYLYLEAVGYLGTDEARFAAFEALRNRVGLAPKALMKAPLPALTAICSIGGIFGELRAKRLKEIAGRVLEEFDGDLGSVLSLDYTRARRALQKFPMIGESGADRILMLCGFPGVLGFQSNEHRTLNRLGYGEEMKNYNRSYRLTRDAARAELPKGNAALVEASLLLRQHGRTTCKTSAPRCEECPLTARCAWFAKHAR